MKQYPNIVFTRISAIKLLSLFSRNHVQSLIPKKSGEGKHKVVYSIDFTTVSKDESLSCIQLPPVYKVEFDAAEPMVKESVALCWDSDERMYVAEINAYMMDGNSTGGFEPVSRVKMLDDLDGDGKMDKSTI